MQGLIQQDTIRPTSYDQINIFTTYIYIQHHKIKFTFFESMVTDVLFPFRHGFLYFAFSTFSSDLSRIFSSEVFVAIKNYIFLFSPIFSNIASSTSTSKKVWTQLSSNTKFSLLTFDRFTYSMFLPNSLNFFLSVNSISRKVE